MQVPGMELGRPYRDQAEKNRRGVAWDLERASAAEQGHFLYDPTMPIQEVWESDLMSLASRAGRLITKAIERNSAQAGNRLAPYISS
jgi:hypothetical protein